MGSALAIALGTGGVADGIQRLLQQQGLVAVQGVEAFESSGEVVRQLPGADLHGQSLATLAWRTDLG